MALPGIKVIEDCGCDCNVLNVPPALKWSCAAVSRWVEELGFPQYKDCFRSNRINGRKLIYVTASSLPNMGITNFQHMKVISAAIRKLLTITEPQWCRSISLQHRDSMGLFLEAKGPTGKQADNLTLSQFLQELQG